MFLMRYFESRSSDDRAGREPVLVNARLEIIFNGIFETHIFRGNRAESRFLPQKNASAVSVYLFAINQGAAPWKPARSSHCLYLSPWPLRCYGPAGAGHYFPAGPARLSKTRFMSGSSLLLLMAKLQLALHYNRLSSSPTWVSLDYGSDLPSCATAMSNSTTRSLKVQRGTVRMRSRPAKTPEVSARPDDSSRSAASNSRPKP
jgi:hypothetical protein